MIRRFRRGTSPHGQKWLDKMALHWERRLAELMEHEPLKYKG